MTNLPTEPGGGRNSPTQPHPVKGHESGYGFGLAITSEIAALFGSQVQLQTGADSRGLRACIPLGRA